MLAASASAKTARLTAGSLVAATTRKLSDEVAGGVGAGEPGDFAGLGEEILDGGAGVWRDDGDAGVGGAEAFDFGLCEVAGADDDAGAGGELEEDGEEVHRPF